MHSEIRLRDIFLPQDRNLIVPRDHLFPIRIIHRTVLRPAVTSITDRKMRPHLLHDQDRQPVQDPELLRHRIRRRVRSDRKLAERQDLMSIHDPLHDQAVSRLFIDLSIFRKVVADCRNHTSVFELHQKIPVLDISDIDRSHI